jgi:hypothetical protein
MTNPPGDISYRNFLKKLKEFGVVEIKSRGKGSERYLVKPIVPNTTKGPSYTLKCHGQGSTIKPGAARACLRRLDIDPADFWD